jgi:hypothetical protein
MSSLSLIWNVNHSGSIYFAKYYSLNHATCLQESTTPADKGQLRKNEIEQNEHSEQLKDQRQTNH